MSVPFVIFGCGGHSRSVADVILANDPNANLFFIDENAGINEKIYGFPILKDIPSHITVYKSIVALGDGIKRKEIIETKVDQSTLVSIISVNAYVSLCAELNLGCFVGNFAHIGPEVCIGENSIINTGAIVEHEVKIGDYCHIAPGSIVCGRSEIGNFVFLGAGAKIIDGINVCSNVVIGAGSTVVNNITESGVYVGTPARKVK